MDYLCKLVVGLEGSLKAEHGTGRNVAPYVEMEWGAKATGVMWEVKKLFDPYDLLNPGVVLNKNTKVRNLLLTLRGPAWLGAEVLHVTFGEMLPAQVVQGTHDVQVRCCLQRCCRAWYALAATPRALAEQEALNRAAAVRERE